MNWKAEERLRMRLEKVARFAIDQCSLDYRSFLASAAEAWKDSHELRFCRHRIKRSPEEIAETRWGERLQREKHERKLALARVQKTKK